MNSSKCHNKQLEKSLCVLNLTLCVQNIAHKNEALHGYISPRVGPRELYRLEIALKIIIPVPTICISNWNNLPFGIEKVDCIEGFKLKLKEHTFRSP